MSSTSEVRMRFVTLGGATVVVTRHPDHPAQRDHRWQCKGCLRGSDTAWLLSEDDARSQANGHAGHCRSMPPDPNPDQS
jgi:hypothetical protein